MMSYPMRKGITMTTGAPELIDLDSGRRVALHRVAEGSSGRTIVFCHAAPGSGTFDPDPDATAARDVTLLAVDRPGYGGSDPLPEGEWATVASAADDLAAVLDRLDTGPVGVAGWSAGGRIGAALAANRPDLVERLGIIATPAPNDAVKWIPDEQQAGIDALMGMPAAEVHTTLAGQFTGMVPEDPHAPEALALLGLSPVDEATVLSLPGARERLATMVQGAYAQGVTGLVDDIISYTMRPWGFDPASVAATTLLLYGSEDPVTGQAHATWWQGHLPNARVEMVPNAGHMVVIPMWERVLAHLVS